MQAWPAPEVPRLPGAGGPVRVHDTARGGRHLLGGGAPVRVYVCGITPYDATHLGHAATYVAFDLLHRALADGGARVRYCQNVTDVDDPLIERAAATGEDWSVLAEREVAGFRADMTALRVLPPDAYVGAVEAVPRIAAAVVELRERGAAYELDGDVYFSVAAAPRFGEVAHLDRTRMLELFAERGGDPGRPGKKDPLDSLLWRAARPGEPTWDSPLGRGRPGWHVECAVIALDELGPTIDVQGGGSDLAFPHHEHGAATAEAITGRDSFAAAYLHAGMVGLAGSKMSKSEGNLVFVARLRGDGVDPAALRLALLARHYRDDWEWGEADLAAAGERLAAWRSAVRRPAGPPAVAVLDRVRAALADDLDAPAALRAVDEWVAAAGAGGSDPAAPALVAATVDALLGVRLTGLTN